MDDLTRVWIHAPGWVCRIDDELVLISDSGARHIDRPISIAFGEQRISAPTPGIERTRDKYIVRKLSPYAERRTCFRRV